jgi:hypothetical protein
MLKPTLQQQTLMTGGLQDIGQAQCTMFPCEHIMQDQSVSVTIDTCLAATDRTTNTVTYCVLDDWLTVHSSITLVDLQLDAQILFYLHIIHLLKSFTSFEHYPAHLQEVYVVIVYM